MIQIITYFGNEKEYEAKNIQVSNLNNPRSFDEFDINIISLNDERIWKNDSIKDNSIDAINDFISLGKIIKNCKKN